MSQINVVDVDKLYSIQRFLNTSGHGNFVNKDTKEIAKSVIKSLIPDSEDETDDLLLTVIYNLMAYASSDGFYEGLNVGLSVVKHFEREVAT